MAGRGARLSDPADVRLDALAGRAGRRSASATRRLISLRTLAITTTFTFDRCSLTSGPPTICKIFTSQPLGRPRWHHEAAPRQRPRARQIYLPNNFMLEFRN